MKFLELFAGSRSVEKGGIFYSKKTKLLQVYDFKIKY